MENFVLNKNGQIDINRKGMESTYKFHLQEINHNSEICSSKDVCDDTATSISSYSNYKQRIDAMFDDSRSILSDMSQLERKRKSLLIHKDSHMVSCKERIISNKIQEKIEKMFEEISVNGLQRHNSEISRSSQREQKSFFCSNESSLKQDFKVTYLGSKPLQDKSVSLLSLQEPLKELYFEYKKNPPDDEVHVLTISKEGLKINISGKEELNQFSTIAVWASVKLSFRETEGITEYAFLPLVTEPDGVDKNLLYKALKNEDEFVFKSKGMGDANSKEHFPIFTVVMKNFNMNKQLECHGFVCKSSEEAIIIAANLYQALMKKLKRKKDLKEQKVKKVDKEVVIEVTEPVEEISAKPKVKVKKPAPPVPEPKLPAKVDEKEIEPAPSPEICNVSRNSSSREERIPKLEDFKEKKESLGKMSQRRGSVPVNIHCNTSEPPRTLRRTVSERGSNGIALKDTSGDGGDILTKVAIPRSRSFLNANGPLTRYSGRHKANTKNEILSPLGFKELFNEFRLHEGLESMDDILNAIIDAEGMSFNDLKPIYKEFLLKLAVTLTKDELYQRSKIIMRRQKKKNKKCSFRKKAFLSSIGFHKLFRKTASKLGKAPKKSSKPTNLEFTSIVFQSTSKKFESNLPNLSKNQMKSCRVKKRPSSRRRLSKRIERVKCKQVSTTSEDSDFFQPKRNTNDSGGGPNRASSGYFSCSECSCDSENCICTRNDKCYCTLGKNKSYNASSSDESKVASNSRSSFRISQQTDQSDSLRTCSCDSESCVKTAKCYCTQNKNKKPSNKIYHLSEVKGICQTPHLHQKEKLHNTDCPVFLKNSCRKHGESIFDQLRQQGFAASESTLSRAASPTTAWLTNEKNLKQKKCLKSSGSLEYLQMQRPDNQCFSTFDNHFLREIQNTTSRRDMTFSNYLEGELSLRKQNLPLTPSFPCGRRPYSSMRCRNECGDNYNLEILRRSTSERTKNFFNSVRSRHSCDNIMNHIKFPNDNDAKSSLRFTRRMDVYNSFSEGKSYNQYEDFMTYKENRRKSHFDPESFSEDPDSFHFTNLKRLDYNLFRNSKPNLDDRLNRKKVLVVSARDPKGKVLYMGTSNRSDISTKNEKNLIDNPAVNASEALAVKKSAEIAALFSDVTLKPKLIHLDYPKDHKQSTHRPRSNSYRTTNLENTLGYLP